MAKIQTVAAIDIGTKKIVVIAGTKDEQGNVRILGFGETPSRGVIRGTVQNVSEVAMCINDAVKQCREMSGLSFKNVFVGMAGQNIRTVATSHTKVVSDKMITQSDVDLLMQEVYKLNKESGEEIIHVIPQSYYVDNVPVGLHPVGCSGKRLDGNFYVVVGHANAVQKIRQAIQMTGLNIIKLIYQPIASAEAVLSADEKEIGTLVADIGAGTTDVTIFHDKELRATASIPFGGNSITNDIKTACQIFPRQAEALKIKHASALSGSDKKIITIKGQGSRGNKEVSLMDLAKITNARMVEILAGIRFIMEDSGYADKISDIVLTGGGSQLNDLSQLVKYCLDREVTISKPRDIVVAGKTLSGEEYATIVGLFNKGLDILDNFEREERRRKEEQAVEAAQKESKDDAPESNKPQESNNGGGLRSWFNKLAETFFKDPVDSKM